MSDSPKEDLSSWVTARIDYLDFATSESDEAKVFHVPKEVMRIGQWADPELPLLHRFGMPSNTDLALRNVPGFRFGDRYKHFTVEFFGIVGEIPSDLRIHTAHQPQRPGRANWRGNILDFSDIPPGEIRAGGYMRVGLDDGSIVSMEVWRTRVFMEGTNMYIEELWHGIQRIWYRRIENIPVTLEHATNTAMVKRLADGLGLPAFYVEQKTRGDELLEDDFKTIGLATIKKLSPNLSKLTDRAFAKASGYNRQTVSKYRTNIRRYGLCFSLNSKNSRTSGRKRSKLLSVVAGLCRICS